MFVSLLFFFFQAEDGIRDVAVTGVQTCALPIASWSMIDLGPPTAASGNPPPIAFPSTLTSGGTPNASSAPPYHLPHVLTSSKIRSAPISVAIFRRPSRNPAFG